MKSERLEDHRHVQISACHEVCTSKEKRSDPLRLSRKADFGLPIHEVSLAPAKKSDHHVRKNARGPATRAQSRQAPAAATQILRACAVETRVDDIERHDL